MINGLETNFSFTTNRIIEEETTISEKTLAVDDLNNQIIELDKEKVELKDLSERSISETFQKSINDDNDAREGELEPLRNDKQSILDDFDRRIDNLQNENTRLLNVGSSDVAVQERQRQRDLLVEQKKILTSTIRDGNRDTLLNLRERLSVKEKDLKEAEEKDEDSYFVGTEERQERLTNDINEIKAEIANIKNNEDSEIASRGQDLDNRIQNITNEINKRSESLGASSQLKINTNQKK